ncbi:SET domain-containing protein [Cylindrobasidium torrendii FP15055 ss-10]|uniref:SET domain-containing protein n=1 Tax=Cylindrobasidium torrendii FP15055 ss-10 TaxID=1314674 RepID=A0A0D7ATQ8_9AGAR|nr:SET domain-containing protein [Cylindrobasidium torrendii FP15055 ss-10]
MSDAWTHLLLWLRENGMDTEVAVERRESEGSGYGLFATKPCSPSTTLFSIPSTALINVKTLSAMYDRGSLTAIQMLSMYLARHRDASGSRFGPYIATLPQDFSFHPLVWIVDGDKRVSILPESTRQSLQKVEGRYLSDLRAVNLYMEDHHELPILSADYLWAWLNVNTRCIFLQLRAKQSHPDNLTMCPILDTANHSPYIPSMIPRTVGTPIRAMKFLSPANAGLSAGQEIFLKYGAHANRTLFVEYGFVNPMSEDTIQQGHADAEVDLFSILEEIFRTSGTYEALKGLLDEHGYWGDWTLHAIQHSAYPSFRTLAALRLYHCIDRSDGIFEQASVELWKDTLSGVREEISDENEERVRETLLAVCERVQKYAVKGMAAADSISGIIQSLWEEEAIVARAVRERLLNREPF